MRLLFILLLVPSVFFAQQDHTHRLSRVLNFPDIPGYKTLKTDLHQHTVFSDGSVWPDIRVMEALMDGLDVISLTEHLEYQPHQADMPHPDRNRSYQIALEEAKDHDLIIIHGAEVTRKMPPGHNNAVFIEDANLLMIKDSLKVFEEANRQGGFVFWNHPHWEAQRKDGVARLEPFHRELIAKNLLHGIEVINDLTISDEALQIALNHNLTIMGTSDVHGLVDWRYGIQKGGHRPITLVFATERKPEAVREALFNRQTVAFFGQTLVGRQNFLNPLLQYSINFKEAAYQGDTHIVTIKIINDTGIDFTLLNKSKYTFHNASDLLIVKTGETMLQVKTLKKLSEIALQFEVLNGVYAPGKHPTLTWQIKID
ncbi:MAG: Sb-PDE family phosphodiesterase [Flavobacteriaceae bacterium]|nr:Sb-PDE family phosphodiesterase [Flavobacteriaceae bacterium]